MLNSFWINALKIIDMAFQPIVNIHTGEIFAVESLLRNYKDAGFHSIDAFFDKAYQDGVLFNVDIVLREKTLRKIKPIYEKNNDLILFYNIDNRILEMEDYENGLTKKILTNNGYERDFITFEISEKYEFKSFVEAQTIFNLYSEQGFNIALDDFGTGFSGLKMLYYLNPQYIKIDRFFISDILTDGKKKLFVSSIVELAKKLKIEVLAEGVETEDELQVCKEIGCNLVQGYFIQRPTLNIDELKIEYQNMEK